MKQTFFPNKYCNKICSYPDPSLAGPQMKAYKEPILQSQCFHILPYELKYHEDTGPRRGSEMKSSLLPIAIYCFAILCPLNLKLTWQKCSLQQKNKKPKKPNTPPPSQTPKQTKPTNQTRKTPQIQNKTKNLKWWKWATWSSLKAFLKGDVFTCVYFHRIWGV